MEEHWILKETEYNRQLSELKEQITQLRAKINSYTTFRSDQTDSFSRMARNLEDPFSFISPEAGRIPFSQEEHWNEIMAGGFDEKFDKEVNEKADRVNNLSKDCRRLQQRRADLAKKLKQLQ
jgi:uncharacterized protein YlxW (UPF0749 family)